MDSQCKQILEYMQTGKRISPIEALNKFGCFRLASRIRDLKDRGANICSEWEYKYDEQGHIEKKWKEYWLGVNNDKQ